MDIPGLDAVSDLLHVVTDGAVHNAPAAAHSANDTLITAIGGACDLTETAMKKETQAEADKAAKTMLEKFNKLHWGTRTAIIGGTVAIGAALGYWLFSGREPEQDGQKIG